MGSKVGCPLAPWVLIGLSLVLPATGRAKEGESPARTLLGQVWAPGSTLAELRAARPGLAPAPLAAPLAGRFAEILEPPVEDLRCSVEYRLDEAETRLEEVDLRCNGYAWGSTTSLPSQIEAELSAGFSGGFSAGFSDSFAEGFAAGVEGGTEDGAEHGAEHGAEEGAEHGAEQGAEHGAEHGTEHDAEHGAEYDARPRAAMRAEQPLSPPASGLPYDARRERRWIAGDQEVRLAWASLGDELSLHLHLHLHLHRGPAGSSDARATSAAVGSSRSAWGGPEAGAGGALRYEVEVDCEPLPEGRCWRIDRFSRPLATAWPVAPSGTSPPVAPSGTSPPVAPSETSPPVAPSETSPPATPSGPSPPVTPSGPSQPLGPSAATSSPSLPAGAPDQAPLVLIGPALHGQITQPGQFLVSPTPAGSPAPAESGIFRSDHPYSLDWIEILPGQQVSWQTPLPWTPKQWCRSPHADSSEPRAWDFAYDVRPSALERSHGSDPELGLPATLAAEQRGAFRARLVVAVPRPECGG